MDLDSNHETQSAFFKFSPNDFEYDPKSPPAPRTPVIHSKFMDFYDETYHDPHPLQTDEFALNPPLKASSSIQSDKENNDQIANKPRITDYMPSISPIRNKNHNEPYKTPKQYKLQLPVLKLPKTITQFQLELSSTPPEVHHRYHHNTISPSPLPLPQFPDIPFWSDTELNRSPFPISYPSYYQSTSPLPLPLHWDSNQTPSFYPSQPQQSLSVPPTLSVSVPPLVECTSKRSYLAMNSNTEAYNNMEHPNKRRKLSHSGEYHGGYQASYEGAATNTNTNSHVPGEFQQQYQPGNMRSDINNGASSMSVVDSENEPILSPHKRKNNEDKSKRALFKEKRNLNINIHSNQGNAGITPNTAPNVAGEVTTNTNSGAVQTIQRIGVADNDRSAMDNAISAPIGGANNNNNLDWFGTDENINTLNANNHGFGDIHMFPMGMGDDQLPHFMMNELNHTEMMDMDLMNTTTHSHAQHHLPLNPAPGIKQEHNMLPPAIQNSIYHPPNLVSRFSVSNSPPQHSPMFMDQINTNSSIYPQNDHNQFEYSVNGVNTNNGLIRSRSLQLQASAAGGPNSTRPSNLPTLRRGASQPQTVNCNNSNGALGVDVVKAQVSNTSNNGSSCSATHVLTPFDYPLSNPNLTPNKTVTATGGSVAHEAHSYYARYMSNIKQESKPCAPIHSAPLYSISNANATTSSYPSSQRNSQSLSATPHNTHFSLSSSLLSIPQHLSSNQHSSHGLSHVHPHSITPHTNKAPNDHFNFLWWYPEIKFCELDPQLIPLP
eukprot:522690_1